MVGTISQAYVVDKVCELDQCASFIKAPPLGIRLTWKTPQDTPHIASPNASNDNDVEKKGMKIIKAIQPMKNIIVGRQPKRSCAQAFTSKPASCPTSAEFDRPDCQLGVINLAPGFAGLGTPKRFWNCS